MGVTILRLSLTAGDVESALVTLQKIATNGLIPNLKQNQ
jgi:hypothetical protein